MALTSIDLLIHSAAQLLTFAGGPQRGAALGTLGMIEDGAVAIHHGAIVATGTTTALRHQYQPAQLAFYTSRRRWRWLQRRSMPPMRWA